jgi:hypothetical protein
LDLKQLLSVIDNIRDRALLLLLLRTGMRRDIVKCCVRH